MLSANLGSSLTVCASAGVMLTLTFETTVRGGKLERSAVTWDRTAPLAVDVALALGILSKAARLGMVKLGNLNCRPPAVPLLFEAVAAVAVALDG